MNTHYYHDIVPALSWEIAGLETVRELLSRTIIPEYTEYVCFHSFPRHHFIVLTQTVFCIVFPM